MLVVAHRGASAELPENTLAAFELAIKQGADMVEFDVRRSRDGVLFVRHGARLGRRFGRLAGLSFEQIRALPGGADIPTLAEVLALARGRVGVDVEVKVRGVEAEVLEQVTKLFGYDQFVITSFWPGVLRRVRTIDSRARLGLLVLAPGFWPLFRYARADFLALPCAMADLGWRRLARWLHIPVAIWTVNDARRGARYAADPNVMMIITNRPDQFYLV